MLLAQSFVDPRGRELIASCISCARRRRTRRLCGKAVAAISQPLVGNSIVSWKPAARRRLLLEGSWSSDGGRDFGMGDSDLRQHFRTDSGHHAPTLVGDRRNGAVLFSIS